MRFIYSAVSALVLLGAAPSAFAACDTAAWNSCTAGCFAYYGTDQAAVAACSFGCGIASGCIRPPHEN